MLGANNFGLILAHFTNSSYLRQRFRIVGNVRTTHERKTSGQQESAERGESLSAFYSLPRSTFEKAR